MDKILLLPSINISDFYDDDVVQDIRNNIIPCLCDKITSFFEDSNMFNNKSENEIIISIKEFINALNNMKDNIFYMWVDNIHKIHTGVFDYDAFYYWNFKDKTFVKCLFSKQFRKIKNILHKYEIENLYVINLSMWCKNMPIQIISKM